MTMRPPDLRMTISESGGPRTDEELFPRTTEIADPPENNPNTDILRVVTIIDDLSLEISRHQLPIPPVNLYSRSRGHFESPALDPAIAAQHRKHLRIAEGDAAKGRIHIDSSLVWTDPEGFLQGLSAAVIEIEIYCLGHSYSDGYRGAEFRNRARAFGIGARKAGTYGKETHEDFELRLVRHSRADIAFREIIASEAFARLRRAIPNKAKDRARVSKKTGLTRTETSNASKTIFDCPGCGCRAYGKPGSRLICEPCSPPRDDNVLLVPRMQKSVAIRAAALLVSVAGKKGST
jgi:hypothetical protein